MITQSQILWSYIFGESRFLEDILEKKASRFKIWKYKAGFAPNKKFLFSVIRLKIHLIFVKKGSLLKLFSHWKYDNET